jgi:hypothetical protein
MFLSPAIFVCGLILAFPYGDLPTWAFWTILFAVSAAGTALAFYIPKRVRSSFERWLSRYRRIRFPPELTTEIESVEKRLRRRDAVVVGATKILSLGFDYLSEDIFSPVAFFGR